MSRIVEYVGTGPETGTVVPAEAAYKYALHRCLNGTPEEQKEFREMLEEWFYSGNWVSVTHGNIFERRYQDGRDYETGTAV